MMKLKAVIFDWAGTTVDFGCFGPTGVFIELFRQKGIDITDREARGPMGMHKRDHIRSILNYQRIKELWIERFGKESCEADVEELFQIFVPMQLSVIGNFSSIVPGLLEAVAGIRAMNMKIGSTTGYNNQMMEILARAAAEQGYVPDCIVCATDVKAGRPAPWMAFRNAEMLDVYPMSSMVKIGDTIADIEEGVNAGMWSIGVIMSGNELALSQQQIEELEPSHLNLLKENVRKSFLNAGAHYVIDSLESTGQILELINTRLAAGEKP